jgi:hypothetical protein
VQAHRQPTENRAAKQNWRWLSEVVYGFLGIDGVFKLHIPKFFGVKNFATLQALDKLGVFVPGDNTYLRVFADGCHLSFYRLIELLFPQDCIGLLHNLKPESAESLHFRPFFYVHRPNDRQAGLEIPTETVVY